jgi:hypothetical protein
MPNQKTIEIDCATIEVLEPQLLHIVYRNDYEVELVDVQEVDRMFQELAGDKVVYVIMDTKGQFTTFSSEAQKYLSKKTILVQNKQLGGFALLIDSLPNRILARFYTNVYKPNYKLKVFAKDREARVWLDRLKKEDEKSSLKVDLAVRKSDESED